jgi:uncharacterized protein YjbI with pentapeptide repeats
MTIKVAMNRDFTDKSFKGAILENVRFDGCIFNNTDMTGAVLKNVHFSNCDMSYTDFTQAAEVSGMKFSKCLFTEVTVPREKYFTGVLKNIQKWMWENQS